MYTRRAFSAVLLVAALAFSGIAEPSDEGKPAPALSAKLLNGEAFSTSGAAGKVIVINFWATWCAPCRAEMPAMDAYYRKHKAEGLELIAISMDEPGNETKVREVMQAFDFPAAMSKDASYKAYGRIWRLPLTFVIDRQGILRKDGWFGSAGIDEASLEKIVTPLLQSQ
jgi:thiol-disulfide isomerase/thioredoxin